MSTNYITFLLLYLLPSLCVFPPANSTGLLESRVGRRIHSESGIKKNPLIYASFHNSIFRNLELWTVT